MAEKSSCSYLFLWLMGALLLPSSAQTCKSHKFSSGRFFNSCVDLPYSNAFLHWSFFPSNGSIDMAFRAAPATADQGGWVAWAINPTGTGMAGAEALVAFMDSGSPRVITTQLRNYNPAMKPENLSLPVGNLVAEFSNSSNEITIFATVGLPGKSTSANHVWQVGSSVDGGVPKGHSLRGGNIRSMGRIDFQNGENFTTKGRYSNLKIVHGIMSGVSWGIMMPLATILARYMKVSRSTRGRGLCLHELIFFWGYLIGVASWGIGLKLGKVSHGVRFSAHRNIGIAMFTLSTFQMLWLSQPPAGRDDRLVWKFFHHSIGYSVIIMSILNVFKGMDILDPGTKWRVAYIAVVGTFAGVAAVLEVLTWVVVIKRGWPDDEEEEEARRPAAQLTLQSYRGWICQKGNCICYCTCCEVWA